MMNETAQEQPRFVFQQQQQQPEQFHQQQQQPLQHHGVVRRDVLPAGFQEPE